MAHVKVEVRREQLIDAAIRVISLEGAASATTRRIAAEVEGSLASLHYSFRNKEALFEAVYDHCLRATREAFDTAVPPGCGMEAAIRSLMRASYEHASKEPQNDIAMYELLSWQVRRDASNGGESTVYPPWFDLVADCYDRATDGVHPRRKLLEIARFTMAAIDGTFLQLLVMGDDAATRRMYRRLVDSTVALAHELLGTTPTSAGS